MATLDLTVLPAKVTVKNIAKDKKIFPAIIASDVDAIKQDVGATHAGALDAQAAEADGAVAEVLATEVQLFRVNLFKKLEVEDEIVIKVDTSAELLYWELMKEKHADMLEVTIEAFE